MRAATGAMWRLRALGVLSLLLFWLPLWAPLFQAATLVLLVTAFRRGRVDPLTAVLAIGGAAAGLALFAATEFVWVV